jgi:hypothetical protein
MLAPQLGALLLVLLAALIATGCGTSARATGTNSQRMSLAGKLPEAVANQNYNAVLSVSGGSAPYHFSVKSGSLPQGLTLNPATGSISGTPALTGTYAFDVTVTDASGLEEAVGSFVVKVGGGGSLKISVSPTSTTMVSNQKQQFTAAVTGTPNTGVICDGRLGRCQRPLQSSGGKRTNQRVCHSHQQCRPLKVCQRRRYGCAGEYSGTANRNREPSPRSAGGTLRRNIHRNRGQPALRMEYFGGHSSGGNRDECLPYSETSASR